MSDIMSCERFEERLADYMEADAGAVSVTDTERERLDAHATTCAACAELVADLRAITAQAATLGPIDPPASVWAGIDSRLAADVVPIATAAPRGGRARRAVPLGYGIAAAVAMMAAASGITYVAMRISRQDAGAPVAMVTRSTPAESTTAAPAGGFTALDSSATGAGARRLVSSGTRAAVQTPASVVHTRRERPSAGAVYDSEISRLRDVLKERRAELDPRTVVAIEQSIGVIDGAIAQARAALAADPASRFLNHQLNSALGKKMELLRTAAMLPGA